MLMQNVLLGAEIAALGTEEDRSLTDELWTSRGRSRREASSAVFWNGAERKMKWVCAGG